MSRFARFHFGPVLLPFLAALLACACSGGSSSPTDADAVETPIAEVAGDVPVHDPYWPDKGKDPGATQDPGKLDAEAASPEVVDGPKVSLALFVHLEGWPADKNKDAFDKYVAKIRDYASLFETHGARVTWESKELTAGIVAFGDNVLKELEGRGHGVGIHADIGTDLNLTHDGFVSFLKDRKTEFEDLGLHPRHVSGVCSWLDWRKCVEDAGFDFVSSTVQYCLKALPPRNQPEDVKACSNPADCHEAYPADLKDRLHPWRMSPDDFRHSSPSGKVVNITSGGLLACLEESPTDPDATSCPFAQGDLDAFFSLLDQGIAEADPAGVNSFSVTWSFGSALDETLLEKWLAGIDTYVARGDVQWRTAGETHDALVAWEKAGGVSRGPGDGLPEGDDSDANYLNLMLEMHSGEGDDPLADCLMSGKDTLTTVKYTTCRDGQRQIDEALAGGKLHTPRGEAIQFPMIVEFHPRFLDMLATDEESGAGKWSFKSAMTELGHQMGVHNHTECHTGAEGGESCKNAIQKWGDAFDSPAQKKSPSADQWEVRVATYDLLDTLHPATLGLLDIHQISVWGTDFLYSKDPDLVIARQLESGYSILTGHAMVVSTYDAATAPECAAAEALSGSSGALVHPRTLKDSKGQQSLVYYDNRPALFGEPDFKPDDLIADFERALKCLRAERDPDQAYLFVMATHLHNILAGTSALFGFSGIEDLQSFLTVAENLAGKYSVRIRYRNFDGLTVD